MATRRMKQPASRRAKTLSESKCKNCKNAKFDELWGEYKCLAHGIRLYNYDKILECEEYDGPNSNKK